MNRAAVPNILYAALAVAALLVTRDEALAQIRPETLVQRAAASPSRPQVAPLGSDSNLISAAANERGTFVWIVDPVQHFVTLCEKASVAKDFTCSRKPLP